MTMVHGSGMRSSRRPSRSGLADGDRSSRGIASSSAVGTWVVIGSAALVAGDRLHGVPAELVAQRGEDLVGVAVRLAAAAEALDERERDDRGRHVAVDRLENGPAPLARVVDP